MYRAKIINSTSKLMNLMLYTTHILSHILSFYVWPTLDNLYDNNDYNDYKKLIKDVGYVWKNEEEYWYFLKYSALEPSDRGFNRREMSEKRDFMLKYCGPDAFNNLSLCKPIICASRPSLSLTNKSNMDKLDSVLDKEVKRIKT
eukprot:GHVP01068276.1.p1 GENE.GHVP01068276.1~~GHVP01068276.1.p1  ORF type:complete len:144 (+),score=15.40 GHVP01068276.1:485-916(+)